MVEGSFRDRLSTNASLPAVLNAALVCAGYFYIGQWKKGIAAVGAAILIGIPTLGVGLVLLNIATALDVHQQTGEILAGRPIGHWTFFRRHLGDDAATRQGS